MAYGLLITMFLFFLTWGFGILAFIRNPDAELPDFYPVFQVSRLFSGLCHFTRSHFFRFLSVISLDILLDIQDLYVSILFKELVSSFFKEGHLFGQLLCELCIWRPGCIEYRQKLFSFLNYSQFYK